MKILLCPDKFKGSISADNVCNALREGLLSSNPHLKIVSLPMADGGEGSLDVLMQNLDLTKVSVSVSDPLFRQIEVEYLIKEQTAYIEMSRASGLALLSEEDRNCMYTTSFGTGELILHAVNSGIKHIYLFIGGSATNDGGIGIAAALGYEFLDADGQALVPIGKNLLSVKTIDKSKLTHKLQDVQIQVVCDVTNPFDGLNGAAFIYVAQKGANTSQIKVLDAGLKNLAAQMTNHGFVNVSKLPGAGAAGGVGGGMVALLYARIVSGIDTFVEITDLELNIRNSDLVITGEGYLDDQTLQGKVVKGISSIAQKHDVPVIVVCGDAEQGISKQLGIDLTYKIIDRSKTLYEAMNFSFEKLREVGTVIINDYIEHQKRKEQEMNSDKLPIEIKSWIDELLKQQDISIKEINFDKPWGGYYVLAEESLTKFVGYFFPELLASIKSDQPWSPKLLFVAPNKKLSWQYHFRRSEVWKVIRSKVAIVRSPDDEERSQEVLMEGDEVKLYRSERHRLIGLEDWGVVAEIWQHTESDNLSDENDIVRVQDDFGR